MASPEVRWAPYDHRLLTTTSSTVFALVAHPREVVTAAWQGSHVLLPEKQVIHMQLCEAEVMGNLHQDSSPPPGRAISAQLCSFP